MYTYAQVMNGISMYIDNEILNKIDGWQKWIIGSGAGLALTRATEVFNNIKQNEIVKVLGVIDNNDNIDVDVIYENLKKQAQKGAITFDVPLIGAMTLNDKDVDKLYEYIKQQ